MKVPENIETGNAVEVKHVKPGDVFRLNNRRYLKTKDFSGKGVNLSTGQVEGLTGTCVVIDAEVIVHKEFKSLEEYKPRTSPSAADEDIDEDEPE